MKTFKSWLYKRLGTLSWISLLTTYLRNAAPLSPSEYENTEVRKQVMLVFFLTGGIGFVIGLFGHTTWQVVVQASQVFAGIVEYPEYNPFYVGQMTTYSLFNQIGALFLLLGISERTLSFCISGLLGMLSFQALALCVAALSRNKILAILSPVFIHFTKATDFGVIYPIWLLGSVHTYGILGRSFVLLIIALMGVGQFKWGALLLGLAPAIHPTLGAFLWLVVSIAFVWDLRHLWGMFKSSVKYFIAGCCITLFSMGSHFLFFHKMPPVNPAIASKYFSTFIQFWDNHRRPISFSSPGIYLVIASLVISVLWLKFFKQDLLHPSRFLLRIFFISGALGLGFALLSLLPHELAPKSLVLIMPARFLNVNILAFMAILLGLLGYYQKHLGIQCIFGILVVIFVLSRIIHITLHIISSDSLSYFINVTLRSIWIGQGHRRIAWIGMLSTSVAVIMFKYSLLNRRNILYIIRGLILLTLGIALVLVGIEVFSNWKDKNYGHHDWITNDLRDWTNDPLFATAHERQGMLLTCGDMYLIQLRTRRPILLEGGALDHVSYAPATGPEVERILKEVYGVDYFNPPEEALTRAVIPIQYTKPVWEARPFEEWLEIRKRFEVHDVLTYRDWKLNLPVLAYNERFILYTISE